MFAKSQADRVDLRRAILVVAVTFAVLLAYLYSEDQLDSPAAIALAGVASVVAAAIELVIARAFTRSGR